MYSTFVPTIFVAGTTSLTDRTPEAFGLVEADALRLWVRTAKSAGPSLNGHLGLSFDLPAPLMSDMQLAKAIAVLSTERGVHIRAQAERQKGRCI